VIKNKWILLLIYNSNYRIIMKHLKKHSTDDILMCLYEIIDEDRIKNNISDTSNMPQSLQSKFRFSSLKGIFTENSDVLGRDYGRIKGFSVSKNGKALSFQIQYVTDQISDDEVREIISHCKGHLESIGCKMTMFIGFGEDEGWSSTTEYSDFNKMIQRNVADKSLRNIVIKITTPQQILESFKKN
jgi:hypothetical protein